MHDATRVELRSFIGKTFAAEVGLDAAEVFVEDVTLAELVRRSPKLVNSIDLMECFARTSNAIRRSYGVRVRLPPLSPNLTLPMILESFLAEIERPQREAQP